MSLGHKMELLFYLRTILLRIIIFSTIATFPFLIRASTPKARKSSSTSQNSINSLTSTSDLIPVSFLYISLNHHLTTHQPDHLTIFHFLNSHNHSYPDSLYSSPLSRTTFHSQLHPHSTFHIRSFIP